MYWDLNNLYGRVKLQRLPVDSFKWRNEKSNFNEICTKKTKIKIVTRGAYLKPMLSIQE